MPHYEMNTEPGGLEAAIPSLLLTIVSWIIAKVDIQSGLEVAQSILSILSLLLAIILAMRKLFKRSDDSTKNESGEN